MSRQDPERRGVEGRRWRGKSRRKMAATKGRGRPRAEENLRSPDPRQALASNLVRRRRAVLPLAQRGHALARPRLDRDSVAKVFRRSSASEGSGDSLLTVCTLTLADSPGALVFWSRRGGEALHTCSVTLSSPSSRALTRCHCARGLRLEALRLNR